MNLAVWVYLVVTLVAIVWLSWHYTLAVESTRWPHVQGRVLKSWAEKTDSEYSYYSPRVEYTYSVDGVRHSSTTVRLIGDRSMRRSRAERVAASYKVGDTVEVWYDPNKPTRATLQPGGARWLLASLIVVSVVGPLLALAFTNEGRRFFAQIGVHIE
jgi:hypothetical protein